MSEEQGPGRHRTTRRGTGHAARKTVTRGSGGVVDPPRPSGLVNRMLNRPGPEGDDFRFAWTRGSCWNPPAKIQCHVNITSPVGWAAAHIVEVTIPEFDSLQIGGTSVHFHARVAPQFRAFFKAVDVKGLKSLLLTQAGAYFSRTKTGHRDALSNHALGTAIDINAPWNGYGAAPARRGTTGSLAPLADFCADFGLYWGGWYSGNKDGMHFECVTLQSEAELRSACTTHHVDYDALFAAPPHRTR
jgi:D-alanyl-D-alanine carboxypeptidase-like protein